MTSLTFLLLLSLLFAPIRAVLYGMASRSVEHTVCPAGPPACDYTILQAAISAAAPGDIVLASPGDYAGPVALKAGVRVISTDGADVTTVYAEDGPVVTYVALSQDDATELTGFTLRLTQPAVDAIGVRIQGGTFAFNASVIRDIVGEPGDPTHPDGYPAIGILSTGAAQLEIRDSLVAEIHGGDGAPNVDSRGGDAAGVRSEGDGEVILQDSSIRQVSGGSADTQWQGPYGCVGRGGDGAGVWMAGAGELTVAGATISDIIGGAPCRAYPIWCISGAGAATGILKSGGHLVFDNSVIHDVAVEPSHRGQPAVGLMLVDAATAEVTGVVIRDITAHPPWSEVVRNLTATTATPDSPCCGSPPGDAIGIRADIARSLTLKASVIQDVISANNYSSATGVSIGGVCDAVIEHNRIEGLLGGFGGQRAYPAPIAAVGIWDQSAGNVLLAANTLRDVTGANGQSWCYGSPSGGGSVAGIYLDGAATGSARAQNNIVAEVHGGDGDSDGNWGWGDADGGNAFAILLGGNHALYHNTLFHTTAGMPGEDMGNPGEASGVHVIAGGEATGHSNALVGHGVGLVVESGGTSTLDYTGFWINGKNHEGVKPNKHEIDANPNFKDPDAGDLHLTQGSPFIDAGYPRSMIREDIDGDPRPVDGDGDGVALADIGADEYLPSLNFSFYLPLIGR